MSVPLLVIVSGPPGAGKTTVARRIGPALGLPAIVRDDIKDRMFDVLGWSDRAWSMKVGAASFEVLYLILDTLLSAGVSALCETTFRGPLAVAQFEKLRDRHGCRFIEVHCSAAPEIVGRRFRERWTSGERHPGHSDGSEINETLERRMVEEHPSLGLGGHLVEVDTTDVERIDWEGIITNVRAALGEAHGSQDR